MIAYHVSAPATICPLALYDCSPRVTYTGVVCGNIVIVSIHENESSFGIVPVPALYIIFSY